MEQNCFNKIVEPLSIQEQEMLQNEESRCVKVFYIKFKCIVVLSLILLAFLLYSYIIVKDLLTDEEISNQIKFLSEMYHAKNGSSLTTD